MVKFVYLRPWNPSLRIPVHRKDRQDRRGRGILFASRSDHVVIRRNDLETDCELMWNELQTASGLKILFGTFYRPPNTGKDYLLLLQESCSRINYFNFNKICLVGDFNLPNFDWINQIPLSSDQLYLKTYEITNDLFLTQVNTFATCDKNILELVLTSMPDLVTDLSTSEGFLTFWPPQHILQSLPNQHVPELWQKKS